MNPDHILLHLSLINGIGPVTIAHIVQHVAVQDLAQLYTYSVSQMQNRLGLRERMAHIIVAGLADKQLLEAELQLLEKNRISFLTLLNDNYPFILKQIYAAPAVLYVRGDHNCLRHESLAVIGSRKSNAYGKKVIDRIVPALVAAGVTIVSGGARGADALAHEATMQSGGKTIVVLGSGLLKPYPAQHIPLFEAVVASGGLLVSSFALEEAAHPENFPARNRIIAGLSKGCVVVQAAEQSGAAITARFALEYGREVFAVPGSLDDELSAGCHRLIQQGAKLVQTSEDILIEFGYQLPQNADAAVEYQAATAVTESLDIPEQKVLRYCQQPISVEELVALTNLDMMQLQIQLFDMQLAGKVSQNFAGLWQRI